MQAFTSHPRHRVYMKGPKDGTMTAKKTYYNRRAISPIVFSNWIPPDGGKGGTDDVESRGGHSLRLYEATMTGHRQAFEAPLFLLLVDSAISLSLFLFSLSLVESAAMINTLVYLIRSAELIRRTGRLPNEMTPRPRLLAAASRSAV